MTPAGTKGGTAKGRRQREARATQGAREHSRPAAGAGGLPRLSGPDGEQTTATIDTERSYASQIV